ncbi:uncharacterized protein [Periplaneta americana]|uniref:uncharacterized protein isoform X2 n=1 Tax=Periplaneta americana TaxID=6978 RepID=UPI0037E7B89C
MFQKKALIIGNMKVLSVIALGVFALGVITFRSVTSLPKIKPTAAAPFNWQQFLPGAQKRAAVVPGDDPSTAGDLNSIYSAVPPKLVPNPMNPYLSLKPFLPLKPTLVPPFVDPNIFIGKKAALLNNLFGSGVAPPGGTPSFIPPWISGGVISSPGIFAEKKTTLLGTTFNNDVTDSESSSLDSKRALTEPEPETEQEPAISAQPRLVVGSPSIWGPPAGVIPTVKPTIVPPGYWSPFPSSPDSSSASGSIPPVVDPSVFFDKKTKFLNELFSSLSAPPSTSGVSARAVVSDSPSDTAAKPTVVPPSFWLQFIPAFATPPPAPTVKPTIVPPGFWVPSAVTKPVGLFGPAVPVVDPAQFVDKKTAFLNTLFSTLNITVTPAPVTTPAPTPDALTAYQDKVAEFLDKLFSAIINNGSEETTSLKRALENADKTKTVEDLKTFLGEADEVSDSTAKLESELDARSAPFMRRSVDESNDTSSNAAQQLPVDALLSAKDKVVDTIIAEMGGIKNNILDTLAELLTKQKEAAATPPPTPASKKKPGPPFGPGGPFGIGGPFGPWGAAAATTTTPRPTPDPEPFQKKVEFLGQVFDTLTKLEKDVTEALNQAVSEAAAASLTTTTTTTTVATPTSTESTSQAKNGTTLLDLIRSRLIELANSSESGQTSQSSVQAPVSQQVPKYARAIKPFLGKPMLATPAPTIVDPSFWVPDTAAGAPVGPDYYIGKTQSFLSKLFASKSAAADDDTTDSANKLRSIKMAVHQGYQSLPPGSEELLQAGGGSTPEKHEGGGLKLHIKVPV